MTAITKHGRELARKIGRANDADAEAVCSLIHRHAVTLQKLAEASCNSHPLQSAIPPRFSCEQEKAAYWARVDKAQKRWDAWIEKREAELTRRIGVLVARLGPGFDAFEDDGVYGLKIRTPDRRYDNMGGEAIYAI